ncbi:MAG: hypothetical protein NPIRA06_15320 [Nitrospirales bacterium]|nr:MAG: hypothetical protein NPIRA06_15320 [Nitrospirales bacterium]
MRLRHPDVMPVPYELIEVFKYPPKDGAEEEEFDENFGLIHEKALAGS